ncbi:Vegetative incompatibility protein HET-E-1 [Lachnellula suecica]|uniref:Vegetative incompatibility protein HET-E-1 n=1 Tax=Lachnellula suecica TaxID=602035 RepID=A0A8T9C085_9HELO|nr:Vegetative incompatibility protein HET-E-1 [Lachnellula suecica]
MRLLNSKTLLLKEFMGESNLPPYAILSHTWGEDEVSLQDTARSGWQLKAGYRKIKYCCQQAAKDGLKWVWVDTCCIDKTSSAELSEAINSMFRWYQLSKVCYAYLSDVELRDGMEMLPDFPKVPCKFGKSRWFTRGWTLQELVAPSQVVFYSQDWELIGTKDDISTLLEKITRIDSYFLLGAPIELASVADRMTWAATRTTTRTEDMAYCLLGIFDVNMPLLYGEGQIAFARLQEEIMRTSNDQSLFAWSRSLELAVAEHASSGPNGLIVADHSVFSGGAKLLGGLLADSPADFLNVKSIEVLKNWPGYHGNPPTMHCKCVYIDLPVPITEREERSSGVFYAVLGCHLRGDRTKLLAIALRHWGTVGRYSGRFAGLVLVPYTDRLLSDNEHIKDQMKSLQIKREVAISNYGSFILVDLPHAQPSAAFGYGKPTIHFRQGAVYDSETETIWSGLPSRNPQAVLVFNSDARPSFAVALWLQTVSMGKASVERIPSNQAVTSAYLLNRLFERHSMSSSEIDRHSFKWLSDRGEFEAAVRSESDKTERWEPSTVLVHVTLQTREVAVVNGRVFFGVVKKE